MVASGLNQAQAKDEDHAFKGGMWHTIFFQALFFVFICHFKAFSRHGQASSPFSRSSMIGVAGTFPLASTCPGSEPPTDCSPSCSLFALLFVSFPWLGAPQLSQHQANWLSKASKSSKYQTIHRSRSRISTMLACLLDCQG